MLEKRLGIELSQNDIMSSYVDHVGYDRDFFEDNEIEIDIPEDEFFRFIQNQNIELIGLLTTFLNGVTITDNDTYTIFSQQYPLIIESLLQHGIINDSYVVLNDKLQIYLCITTLSLLKYMDNIFAKYFFNILSDDHYYEQMHSLLQPLRKINYTQYFLRLRNSSVELRDAKLLSMLLSLREKDFSNVLYKIINYFNKREKNTFLVNTLTYYLDNQLYVSIVGLRRSYIKYLLLFIKRDIINETQFWKEYLSNFSDQYLLRLNLENEALDIL